MENYKEKYEQALGRARTFIQRWDGVEINSDLPLQELKEIFPELRENKDKKIKNEIIDYLKGYIPHHDNNLVVKSKVWIAWLEKQGEQKSADKVEPKFKIGDWVVSNRTNKTYKIDSIDTKDANYIIYSCVPSVYTNEDSPCFSESMIHLWTIQDAKKGDVLVWNDCGDEYIFVFDKLIKEYAHAFIGFNVYLGTIEDVNRYYQLNKLYPATKEQRGLLFQKMKEAGYEWDVEKKELKKIEQKIAWSEEDKNMLQNILECLKNGWSKLPTDILKYESWLKSIKERYTWRPSDEQMEALYTYIYNPQYFNSPDPRMELVESVYKDLKKLKEE